MDNFIQVVDTYVHFNGSQAAKFAKGSSWKSTPTSQPSISLPHKPNGSSKAYKDILKDLQEVAWQRAGMISR